MNYSRYAMRRVHEKDYLPAGLSHKRYKFKADIHMFD